MEYKGGGNPYKNFEFRVNYEYLDNPKNQETKIKRKLSEKNSNILYSLLDFFQKQQIEVLFVVCPYQITQEHWEKFNTIEEIVTSYGYNFLNANKYYDEMGLDFATDFYNADHVNCYGAEKYTDFLEKYIDHNYNLPDHREEKEYENWNESFIQFNSQEKVTKEEIDNLISTAIDGKEIASRVREKTDFFDWSALVSNPCFTVLATSNKDLCNLENELDRRAFSLLGLDIPVNDKYIRVTKNSDIINTNAETGETSYEAIIGTSNLYDMKYAIRNSGEESSIVIGDKEYSRQDEGINIVVFEDDYRYVVDSVTLKCDEDGKIELVR